MRDRHFDLLIYTPLVNIINKLNSIKGFDMINVSGSLYLSSSYKGFVYFQGINISNRAVDLILQ